VRAKLVPKVFDRWPERTGEFRRCLPPATRLSSLPTSWPVATPPVVPHTVPTWLRAIFIRFPHQRESRKKSVWESGENIKNHVPNSHSRRVVIGLVDTRLRKCIDTGAECVEEF